MLLREFIGGDPPYACKLVFRDDPTGFGHRVADGERMVECVLTNRADFEQAESDLTAQGFAETERSLSRRVLVNADRYWIVVLDGNTLRTQFGGIRVDWRESSGQVKDKEFRDRDRAVAAYHRAIADKQVEDYREKYGREVGIAEISKLPQKPGKRKSR
jgi:predicted DNA-binding WGR domain protein